MGLLSDGYLEVQQNKFKALDLAVFFDAVLFTDELGRQYWKPHTRPFKVLLQRLGVKNFDESNSNFREKCSNCNINWSNK